MKIADRQMIAEGIFNNCLNVLECKGKAYSGTEDVLSNFKINAERLGLTKYQIWATYFNKHIDSINNAIKSSPASPVDESEGLEGRITDVINYAVILQALLTEDNSRRDEVNTKKLVAQTNAIIKELQNAKQE